MPNKDDFGMLFGVFDGHGGKDVADYAKDNFKKKFVKSKTFKESKFK
jgi:serine/threonine protein phosphatase PrpC